MTNIRTVTARGVRYLRAEDVATLLREIGSTEATDVRNRLYQMANNLEGLKPQPSRQAPA